MHASYHEVMSDTSPVQRLAENEVAFRQSNEQVQVKLQELQADAVAEGYPASLLEKSTSLYFYCECSDENCRERIVMKPDAYAKIHKDRQQFIIVPGHEVVSIEKVVKTTPKYAVVKKLIHVPKKAKGLHKTDVDNTQI